MKQNQEIFVKQGVALGGYDVVQLLDHQDIRLGDAAFQEEHQAAKWYFISSENQLKFKSDPEKYLPAYGGYCAYGVALGYKAPTRIDTFEIIGGKLYFNFSPYIKRYWLQHLEAFIPSGNVQWLLIDKDEMIRANYCWIYFKYLLYKVLRIPFFDPPPDQAD